MLGRQVMPTVQTFTHAKDLHMYRQCHAKSVINHNTPAAKSTDTMLPMPTPVKICLSVLRAKLLLLSFFEIFQIQGGEFAWRLEASSLLRQI